MEFLVKIRILGKFLDILGFLDDNVKKNTANSIKTNLDGSKKLHRLVV